MPTTLRLDGSPCECGRPTGQCVKGDLDHCPAVDDDDYADDGEDNGGAECGRWNNGSLTRQCRKAGSEECDWDCPIGIGPTRRGKIR